MNRIFQIICVFGLLSLSSFSSPNSIEPIEPIVYGEIQSDERVYICGGPYAEKFHSYPKCRGLNNCSTDIYYFDNQREAIKQGYEYCKLCWK